MVLCGVLTVLAHALDLPFGLALALLIFLGAMGFMAEIIRGDKWQGLQRRGKRWVKHR